MDKLKLLPLEAAIYEGLKAGKTIAQIASEQEGMPSQNMAGRMSWLIKNGIVIRTGKKKKYIYSTPEISYEIIPTRMAVREPMQDEIPDTLLEEMLAMKLTDNQRQIIEKNWRTMGRTELAAEVGITKLQLNHVMIKLGLKKKEVKEYE
ncbi:hypothetical protein HQN89_10725 [Paenibacillus frigoriresistens]|uniref:hypothetical protein n=1 Tax=Paenibacillus alginolyticus TaxID=59839 RepID=UPI0015640A1E|nr:hypothetical protein [Paenibacillus frigoriresistens]NRF91493.1 hypothetical protein [Paenibacillus frigoriresistens]